MTKKPKKDWVDDVVDSGLLGHAPRWKFAPKPKKPIHQCKFDKCPHCLKPGGFQGLHRAGGCPNKTHCECGSKLTVHRHRYDKCIHGLIKIHTDDCENSDDFCACGAKRPERKG